MCEKIELSVAAMCEKIEFSAAEMN